jgi:hypothetical protein
MINSIYSKFNKDSVDILTAEKNEQAIYKHLHSSIKAKMAVTPAQ